MKDLIDPIVFEEFKPITENEIPGVYPGRYSVSNFGRIYDNKLNRYIKLTLRPDNYYTVSLNTDGVSKQYLLHRIVGLLFVPGDKSLIINHLDGNKSNDFFMNLEWSTYSNNNNHAFEHGLMPRGEESSKSLVSEDQVRMICQCLDEKKLTYKEITELCQINVKDPSSLISTIYRGVAWMHISKDYEFSRNYKTNPIYKPINKV